MSSECRIGELGPQTGPLGGQIGESVPWRLGSWVPNQAGLGRWVPTQSGVPISEHPIGELGTQSVSLKGWIGELGPQSGLQEGRIGESGP